MKRSKFSLSNGKLLTFNQGWLVPCGLLEVLPGDSMQQATSALVRTQPLFAPMMHKVDIRIHHWYVPLRLIWEDFEDFITGGPDGDDASVPPFVTSPGPSGYAIGSLADYLGLPTGVSNMEVSALPFRAYAMIWNEWYRDQDLQTPLVISEASGADTTTSLVLQSVAWEKDRFTSARPWAQKGPEVTVPLGTYAPVERDGNPMNFTQGTNNKILKMVSGSINAEWDSAPSASGNALSGLIADVSATGLRANLANAGSASINDLREAFALQRYAEARARYGSRYTEYLRYLGVRSSDARLQRPEYLGGGKQLLQISEVLQTAVTPDDVDDSGVGNLRGHGIGALRSNRYRRFFEEHGYVLSFVSVKPKTMYVQGIPKLWIRETKEDYFQKELQHIGQVEILNKEVYAPHASPENTFGYQDRYDEYRRQENTIAGEFRDTLDFWHMARIFASSPTLNAAFVSANPTDRVYAVTTAHQLQVQVWHSVQARRLVARTGTSFIY